MLFSDIPKILITIIIKIPKYLIKKIIMCIIKELRFRNNAVFRY